MKANRIIFSIFSLLIIPFYMCYPHTIYANGVNITGKMKVYKDNNVNMVMAKIIKSDGEEVELGTIKNMSESARKCIYESSDNGTTVNISAEYCYDGIDNRTIVCKKVNSDKQVFNFNDAFLLQALNMLSQALKSQHESFYTIYKINKNEYEQSVFNDINHLYAVSYNDLSGCILGINTGEDGNISEIFIFGSNKKIDLSNFLKLANGVHSTIIGLLKYNTDDISNFAEYLIKIMKENPSGLEFEGEYVNIRYMNKGESYMMRFSPIN